MNPVRTVAPTSRPVSIYEVKARLRVAHDAEDADIDAMIDEAISKLDGYRGILGRAIMPQTWRETFDGWGTLRLALPNVTTATVTYKDDAGVTQTLTGVDLKADPSGSYVVANGPSGATDITVTYQCQAPADILPSIKRAVCLHVAMSFDDRDGSRFEDFQRAFQAQVAHIRWMGV
jgi:uncharacterized phiE125 gp8 family phage protein